MCGIAVRVCYIVICVAEGESRSRSAVTPSVCTSVCPKFLSSQLLWNYWSNYHETWYADRTSYVVMIIGRKFWSLHFCGSYAPWSLENTHKWPCHCNSSETTDLSFGFPSTWTMTLRFPSGHSSRLVTHNQFISIYHCKLKLDSNWKDIYLT